MKNNNGHIMAFQENENGAVQMDRRDGSVEKTKS